MPKGKGTYGSQVGRPALRKTSSGFKMKGFPFRKDNPTKEEMMISKKAKELGLTPEEYTSKLGKGDIFTKPEDELRY